MYINMLLISAILTGIFYSGFPSEFERIVSTKLKFGQFKLPKPFSCHTCMTWWVTLIYIIYLKQFTPFNIFVCLMLSLSTNVIYSVYGLIFSTLENFIAWLNEHINGQ